MVFVSFTHCHVMASAANFPVRADNGYSCVAFSVFMKPYGKQGDIIDQARPETGRQVLLIT